MSEVYWEFGIKIMEIKLAENMLHLVNGAKINDYRN